MRVVVDTNVIVSGIFWAGTPGRILESWTTGEFELIVSPGILDEYFEVLDRIAARIQRQDLARQWKALLFEHSEMAQSTYQYAHCRDPDDAMFVEAAVCGGASCIITGDDDLLTLGTVEGVAILTPAQFVERTDLS